jgi:isoleucyl-tRNA synthetase
MSQSTSKIVKASSYVNFPQMEKEILKFWKEEDILQKSLLNRENSEIKTFFDGPITANGQPHHGHMLTFSIKDLFPRYWTMKGYNVSRSLGWDCQGIPVEYEIEKRLGFKEKKDIEAYGIAKFNDLCRKSVLEHRSNTIELEEGMGRLTDDKEEYYTMDSKYIESIWWSLGELYKKNLLYEGFKVVPYSTRAGTSLSNAEVALGGYKKMVDKAVTIKFELVNEPKTYILAWTTTPWTLPTNFALAVGKDIIYAKVLDKETEETYILAKDLVEKVLVSGKEYKITDIQPDDLLGLEYKPLFKYFEGRKNCFKVIEGFHVNTSDGTGVVHLAPYGKEDMEIFQEIGIEGIDVLDHQGDFTDQVTDYAGQNYKNAIPKILDYLKENNLLYEVKDYAHDVPMCWRTNTPLIYKPITSWYIAMSKVKNELLENNEKVNWMPAHIKQGRFGHWLQDVKDWGISRLRYWGTPLPIWKSESGKVIVISSYAELEQLSGKLISDPHRPMIDEVSFEKDRELYTRIPDVLDVWYDSGAMPFARFHYPFENKEIFEQKAIADFISEGVDQTRGWFYSLLAISTTVFGTGAFKNVVINGFTLDDKGVKSSKSKGNYAPPQELIAKFGGDTIRFNFFTTPIVAGEDATISANTLKTTTQEFTLPLWNIYVYFTTYAQAHNFNPVFENNNLEKPDVVHSLDVWMLSYLDKSIGEINQYLDKFMIQKASSVILNLINETSTWYIRRNRSRFVDGDSNALKVLYYTLFNIIKLIAPLTPFIAEKIYQDMVVCVSEQMPQSIHLLDYPQVEKLELDNQSVLDQMDLVKEACSLGLKARANSGIKLRQPLSTAIIVGLDKLSPELVEIIREELNVKSVLLSQSVTNKESAVVISEGAVTISLDIELSQELKDEGLYREIARQIQSLRKKQGLQMGQLVYAQIYVQDQIIRDLITNKKSDLLRDLSLSDLTLTYDDSDMNNLKCKVENSGMSVKFS